jgi:uncharacterized protein (DUF169 family)
MNNFKTVSNDLVKGLELQYEPVGVTLHGEGASLPENVPLTQKDLKSYCQALVKAGEGQALLLKKEQMGCKLGTSVLGFEKDTEAYLDDGVLEKFDLQAVFEYPSFHLINPFNP